MSEKLPGPSNTKLYVGGDFFCNRNQLTSLEFAPESIGGAFFCNSNLWTLKDNYTSEEYSMLIKQYNLEQNLITLTE